MERGDAAGFPLRQRRWQRREEADRGVLDALFHGIIGILLEPMRCLPTE